VAARYQMAAPNAFQPHSSAVTVSNTCSSDAGPLRQWLNGASLGIEAQDEKLVPEPRLAESLRLEQRRQAAEAQPSTRELTVTAAEFARPPLAQTAVAI
jgi:hypothetical protein